MKSLAYERRGLRLKVWETGDGPAMVFQHGLCGDASQPAEVFPEESGWRCVMLDCRGHGGSEAGEPEEFSIATFSGDVVSMIETWKLAPVVLGGISMGAAMALRIAALRPELVRGLVLARPAWIADSAPANMGPNALVGELLRRFPAPEARAQFVNSETARELSRVAPDNLASLRGFFSREPAAITAGLLCRISAGGPGVTGEQIRAIRTPAMVIGTARDFVHPLELAKELASWIPDAGMVEIASKAVSREQYLTDFRAAVARFLTRIESGAAIGGD
jgi:pimeloyl-ACP methyl ester carboxylesterase